MQAIIVCGPTASGKSGLAHKIALEQDGAVINADSIQVYKQIPIITASPPLYMQQEVPYYLYNFLDIDQNFSVAQYVHLAAKNIRQVAENGKIPIIVGGSGMYIGALLYGYHEIPEVAQEIRQKVRDLQQELGQEEFFKMLVSYDPLANRLAPLDSQRTIRAMEVFKQTGKSIFSFHDNTTKIKPLPEFTFEIKYLQPERDLLYKICNNRLVEIFNSGAIEEVKLACEQFPVFSNSAFKAIGFQEIKNYLDGKITLEQAVIQAQTRTRQYAKRQITWFTHQLKERC